MPWNINIVSKCPYVFGENSLCEICANLNAQSSLTIVYCWIAARCLAVEQTLEFRGRILVFDGSISITYAGYSPAANRLDQLDKILQVGAILRELFWPLTATVWRAATAHYWIQMCKISANSKHTHCHGVPVGGELEFNLNGILLTHAF